MAEYKDAEPGEASDEGGEKLRHARQLFEEAVDHTRDSHAEAHRAQEFYHNTRGEGQWDSSDLSYLRDEGRMSLTFNIVKDKVDSFLGIYSDAQRSPNVTGSGSEDKLQADILDIVKTQVLQDAKYERKAGGQLKTGTIAGECAMHVEVAPSTKGRDWIDINLFRIMPFEIHWDASSIEADRSDAGYVFWDRLLDKKDFKNAYPDHADMWGQLSNDNDASDEGSSGSYGEGDSFGDALDDYDDDRHSRYYFDRQRRKVRVIRYEYKEFVDVAYATHMISGERTQIDTDQRQRVEMAVEMGEPYEIEDLKEEVVKVCEFVGPKLLAEYDSPGPFDGFSIVDYVYIMDEEEGVAYGMVRNLFDPQMELNKSKSLEIEYIAQSTAPGSIAEEDAMLDERQFSAEMRRAGGVAIVKKGALSGGKVQEKQITAPSAAVLQRASSAMDAIDRISGIASSGMVQPASQAEAATTVALRYHKSRQVIKDPISNYEHAQYEVVMRVVQAISRAMPDDQIQAIVANDSKYQVGNGMVVEMAQNPEEPDGPPVPKSRAMLRDLRSMQWNIELEHSSGNTTLRMMEFDVLIQMISAGVPVDPEIIVETSTDSRHKQERLKAYVEKSERANAQGSQREAEMFQSQIQQAAQGEAVKAQETARHNQATEMLKHQKQESDASAKLAELWADAEDSEKDFVLNLLRDQQQERLVTQGQGLR